jgi:hypothetical protein
MFMPTTGENFGHIIFQSFSNGIPVIISDQTPWRHLHSKSLGWDLPLTDIQGFVSVINHLNKITPDSYSLMSEAVLQHAVSYQENTEILAQNRNLFLA